MNRITAQYAGRGMNLLRIRGEAINKISKTLDYKNCPTLEVVRDIGPMIQS